MEGDAPVKQSSIQYSAQAPAGVSGATQAALAPFGPQWSSHHGSNAVLLPGAGWLDASARRSSRSG